MKIRLFSFIAAALLVLTACGNGVVSAANVPSSPGNADLITEEKARDIALEHAGLSADQVQFLRVNYEIDDGVDQYDVEFRHDRWEYNYDIDAKTGQILTFERDD